MGNRAQTNPDQSFSQVAHVYFQCKTRLQGRIAHQSYGESFRTRAVFMCHQALRGKMYGEPYICNPNGPFLMAQVTV